MAVKLLHEHLLKMPDRLVWQARFSTVHAGSDPLPGGATYIYHIVKRTPYSTIFTPISRKPHIVSSQPSPKDTTVDKSQPPPEGAGADQAGENARLGLWADFSGSFTNTLKAQANGAVQLADKAGASVGQFDMAAVDKASFASKEWFTELAGQASALALEFGVLRRIGVSGTQALGLRAGGVALEESALGKSFMSAGTGMFMGGVLTPSEHEDGAAFWTDRLKSMGTMTATTLSMGALAQPLGRLGATMSSKILGEAAATAQGQSLSFALTSGEASTAANKLIDGAVRSYMPVTMAGLGGGTVGGITQSALNGDSFDLKTAETIGSHAIEYALIGAGAHTVDLAINTVAAAWTSLPQAKLTPPGRMTAEQAAAPQIPRYIKFADIEQPRTVVERRIARSLEGDRQNQSVWYDSVDGQQRFASLKGDVKKQIVVVGAGSAGLQAAHELSAHGFDVAVVDSGIVAGGATGAMAGMIVRIPDEGYLKIGKLYGDDMTKRVVGELASAHDVILRQAQSMDTDFVQTNFYKGSNRFNGGYIDRELNYVRQFDNNVESIKGPEAQQRVPGSNVIGAQLGGGNLNPRKLALGLASSGRFSVYEKSPVLGMTVQGADRPVTLHTPEGTITADKVIFATGGPAAPFRYLQDRLLPAQAFAVSANHGRNLDGGFADSSGFLGMNYNYWRDVVPGRVLFGGADRALQVQWPLTGTNKTLLSRLTRRYPEAQADNQWTGTLFLNPTSGLPIVAQHPDYHNVWGVTALGGVGLVNGAFAAKVLRQQLDGTAVDNILSPEFLFADQRAKASTRQAHSVSHNRPTGISVL